MQDIYETVVVVGEDNDIDIINSNNQGTFKSYKEHYISRWLLKLPKFILVLAIGDHGIFAFNKR